MKNVPLALANMRENSKRDTAWLVGFPKHDHELVPVCGGPSLRSRLRQVKARQRNGGRIVACNGAAGLLCDAGIKPTFVAFVDPSPVVEGFIDDRITDAIYLVASICHPRVFDRLEKAKRSVILWHPNIGEPEQEAILEEYPLKPGSLIGGGTTIGLRMLNLGFVYGFRTFHFYGLDSSYADDGADHAYQKHDGPEDGDVLTAKFNGKIYKGSSWMIKQAGEFMDEFFPLFSSKGCKIHVHGEGLIPDMCRAMHKFARAA